MFKCLIFVQGLTTPKDKEIRSRILTIMEQDPNITLQKVTEECQRLINIKKDNTRIEEKCISRVQTVKQQKWIKNKEQKFICSACGGQHLKKYCFFKDKICFNCGRIGHRSSHCMLKQKKGTKRDFKTNVNVVLTKKCIQNGPRRKYLNVKINGQTVKLLLYSGSDISVISEQTWKKIGCPELRRTNKIAKGVSGKRLKFIGELICDVSFIGKIHKSKVYILPGSMNLFGTD